MEGFWKSFQFTLKLWRRRDVPTQPRERERERELQLCWTNFNAATQSLKFVPLKFKLDAWILKDKTSWFTSGFCQYISEGTLTPSCTLNNESSVREIISLSEMCRKMSPWELWGVVSIKSYWYALCSVAACRLRCPNHLQDITLKGSLRVGPMQLKSGQQAAERQERKLKATFGAVTQCEALLIEESTERLQTLNIKQQQLIQKKKKNPSQRRRRRRRQWEEEPGGAGRHGYSSDSCTIILCHLPRRLPWQPHSDPLVLGGRGAVQQWAEAPAAAGTEGGTWGSACTRGRPRVEAPGNSSPLQRPTGGWRRLQTSVCGVSRLKSWGSKFQFFCWS